MRPTSRAPFFAVLLLCAAASCAPAAETGEPSPSAAAEQGGRVEVTNDAQQDMVLFLMRDAVRYRLGYVSRMQTAEFRLPRAEERDSYQVSLIAQPVGGGRAFATAPLLWRPGQTLLARVGRSASFDVILR